MYLLTYSLLHIAHAGLAEERVYFWSEVPGSQCSVPYISVNIRRLLFLWHTQRGSGPITANDCVTGRWASCSGHAYLYCWIIFRAYVRLSSTSTYCPFSTPVVLGRRVTHRWLFSSLILTTHSLEISSGLLEFQGRSIKYFFFFLLLKACYQLRVRLMFNIPGFQRYLIYSTLFPPTSNHFFSSSDLLCNTFN